MIMILFVFFLIASAFTANKIIVQIITPEFFVFLRMIISGILLLIIYCRSKKIVLFINNNIGRLITISLFTTFLPSLLRAYALQEISSSRAAFWGTFEPFITAFYMYILFGKKLNNKQFFACFMGFIGALLFIFINSRETMGIHGASLLLVADMAQILSVVASRYGWICAQTVLKENSVTPEQLNGITFTLSGLFAFIMVIFKKSFDLSASVLTWKMFLLLAYTVVIGNMLAYTLYGYLLKRHSATFIALSGLSMPLFVHLIGLSFLNEQFSPGFIVALLFVGFGIYIFNIYQEKSI